MTTIFPEYDWVMNVLGALLIAAVGCAVNNQTKLTLNQSSDVSELLASQMEELKQESEENSNDAENLTESDEYMFFPMISRMTVRM